MQKPISKWINFLYGPFFAVIGFFYRNYTANRARIERFKENKKVSSVLTFLMVLVTVVWILVWLLAPEESRDRLTEEVKKSFGYTETSTPQQPSESIQPAESIQEDDVIEENDLPPAD